MVHEKDPDFSKKQIILNTTLDLLKKEGFEGITIRKIAKEANVNVALINYYYGSKDKLLNSVVQMFVVSMKETFSVFDDDTLQPKERLKRFLIQYLQIHKKYPFIVQTIIQNNSFSFDSQQEFIEFIRATGIKKIQRTIEELSGETDPEKLNIMTSHIMGAAFLPTFIDPLYQMVTGTNFLHIETHIDTLLDRYFANNIELFRKEDSKYGTPSRS